MINPDKHIQEQLEAIFSFSLQLLKELDVKKPILSTAIKFARNINIQARKLEYRGSGIRSIPQIDEVKEMKKSISSARAASIQIYSNLDEIKRLNKQIKNKKIKPDEPISSKAKRWGFKHLTIEELETKKQSHLKESLDYATSAVNESKKALEIFKQKKWMDVYYLNRTEKYRSILSQLFKRKGYYMFLTDDQIQSMTRRGGNVEYITLENQNFDVINSSNSYYNLKNVKINKLIGDIHLNLINSIIKNYSPGLNWMYLTSSNSKIIGDGSGSNFKLHFDGDIFNTYFENLLVLIPSINLNFKVQDCKFINILVEGISSQHFIYCTFKDCDFTYGDSNYNINSCNFESTTFKNINFKGVKFRGCDFINSTFKNVDVKDATFEETCDLTKEQILSMTNYHLAELPKKFKKLQKNFVDGKVSLATTDKGALAISHEPGALSKPEPQEKDPPKEETNLIRRIFRRKRKKK